VARTRNYCVEDQECDKAWIQTLLIIDYNKKENNLFCMDQYPNEPGCLNSFANYAHWSICMGVLMIISIILSALIIVKLCSIMKEARHPCLARLKVTTLVVTKFVLNSVPFISFPIYKFSSKYFRDI
jgi:hypothetical protein